METKVLTSLKQLTPLPKTYREIVQMLLASDAPRIGEVDHDTAKKEIAKVTDLVYGINGFKDVMDKDQAAKVLEFIIFNYKELHPVEIEIAFDLAAKGAIKTDLSRGFNVRYIAGILNSYIMYRKGVSTPKAEKKPAIAKPVNTLTPESIRNQHIETINGIIEFYNKFKSGIHEQNGIKYKLEEDYRVISTYAYLVKRNIINPVMTDDAEMWERAKVVCKDQKKSKSGIQLVDSKEDIEETYKYIMIAKLFIQWDTDKTDVKSLLMKDLK